MGPTIHLLARNEILLEGLRTVIAGAGIDVTAVTTVIGNFDYCKVSKRKLPDALVLDARLIGDNPFAIISELRRCHATLRIIVMVFDETPFPPLSLVETDINGLIHATEARLLPKLVKTPLDSGLWLSNWSAHRIVASNAAIGSFGLSKREITVMELVEDGMSNRAIAQHLSLSVRTVDFHVHNALGKLGARNRTEAVKKLHLAKPDG